MLILMITITTIVLVAGICFYLLRGRKRRIFSDISEDDMRITFPDTDDFEPVTVLSDETRALLRKRSLHCAESDSLQTCQFCPDPFLKSRNGYGKPPV